MNPLSLVITREPISYGDDDPIPIELENVSLDALDRRIDQFPNRLQNILKTEKNYI